MMGSFDDHFQSYVDSQGDEHYLIRLRREFLLVSLFCTSLMPSFKPDIDIDRPIQ